MPLQITPLGDSITDGYNIPGGYRIKLESLLATKNLDFAGSMSNGPSNLNDKNHEGHPGWRIDHIADWAEQWFTVQRPGIITLMIGTNDMLQNYDVSNASKRLSGLLDQLTKLLPNTHILVASIPPISKSSSANKSAAAYNAALPGIVADKVNQGKKVSFVDIAKNLTFDDLADGVHPNQVGYDKIADAWSKAIDVLYNNGVNDAPTDLVLSQSDVNEGSTVGTVVGLLSTVDLDANDSYVYRFKLENGTLSDSNGPFKLVGNELRVNGSLNYETQANYVLTLRTTDSGGQFTEKALTVVVNDLNGSVNTLNGTSSSESWMTSAVKDVIHTASGNDAVTTTLANLKQQDQINGGDGTDTLVVKEGTTSDTIEINLTFPGNQLRGLPGTLLTNFERFDLNTFVGTTRFTGSNSRNDWIQAGRGNDLLVDGDGDDYLDGGQGTDTLQGGRGNDTYIVDHAGDIVVEAYNSGTDTVKAAVSWTLGNNLEKLYLTGSNPINGTGNSLSNSLYGNSANNSLDGGSGSDTLGGGAANDTLLGGASNDKLYGDAGSDSLTGGSGNDTLYLGSSDGAVDKVYYASGDGADTIYHFVRGAGGDQVSFTGLSSIDVVTVSGGTQLRAGNGVGGDSGFGTGTLLVSIVGPTDFTAADVGVNLMTTGQFFFG